MNSTAAFLVSLLITSFVGLIAWRLLFGIDGLEDDLDE